MHNNQYPSDADLQALVDESRRLIRMVQEAIQSQPNYRELNSAIFHGDVAEVARILREISLVNNRPRAQRALANSHSVLTSLALMDTEVYLSNLQNPAIITLLLKAGYSVDDLREQLGNDPVARQILEKLTNPCLSNELFSDADWHKIYLNDPLKYNTLGIAGALPHIFTFVIYSLVLTIFMGHMITDVWLHKEQPKHKVLTAFAIASALYIAVPEMMYRIDKNRSKQTYAFDYMREQAEIPRAIANRFEDELKQAEVPYSLRYWKNKI